MSPAWEEIDLYGNRDLLTREYVARHGGRLNEQKARQISASLSQAKQYFVASEEVGLIARPLLVYYGVLSLARAIVLYRSAVAKEESLHGSHGLSTLAWAPTLGGSLANVQDLRIEVNQGTFTELLDATLHVERFAPLPHDFIQWPSVGLMPTPRLPALTQISVGDILARFPELAELYRRVFQKEPETFIAWMGGAAGDIPFQLSTFNVVNILSNHKMEDVSRILNVPLAGDGRASFNWEHGFFGSKKFSTLEVKLGEGLGPTTFVPPLGKLIDPDFRTQHTHYFNWPIQDHYYPTTIARMFLLSYSLGMLGRYFPSVWMSGISNENDTACFPLLAKAVVHLQQLFPSVALAEFIAP